MNHLAPFDAAERQARATDWRVGGVVYQVLVDRFAIGRPLEPRRADYAPPRRLRTWEELPAEHGHHAEAGLPAAQLDFWGGDLEGVRQRLGHVTDVGADVLYLNPIFEAFTNHKYDTTDYRRIDPQFGDAAALGALVREAHTRGLRVLLDGVFNHVGRRHPWFERALRGEEPYRSWFRFRDDAPGGVVSWKNVDNLPELRLEEPSLRDELWRRPDSVVGHWLRTAGVDGFRLDTAPDLGPNFLRELTDAAHEHRPGSAVIGECWTYPDRWLQTVDGVMNMHLREVVLPFAEGKLPARQLSALLRDLLDDCDPVGLLRSHLVLDNHDTPRLAWLLRDVHRRRLARVLQIALPGCPVVWMGSELGMVGGPDPECRAPMRWGLANDGNEELVWTRKLLALRRDLPALRIGDTLPLATERTFAFLRVTDDPQETVLVVVNASDEAVSEWVPLRDGRVQDHVPLVDALSSHQLTTGSGLVRVELPPRSARLYVPADMAPAGGYSFWKRVGAPAPTAVAADGEG